MDNETFSTRDEAIDVGRDYEYLIPAYYALIFAFNENIINFKLSTNNKAYGDFDDVIIEIEFANGEEHVFALQLKHIRRIIAQVTLITNNKKFSLSKYNKEFQAIKTKHSKSSLATTNFKNFHFILFSNSSLEKSEEINENWSKLEPVANDKKIESDVLIKKIETCFAKDLLNTSDLGETFVFKSQKEDSPDQEFFEQFYFFTKQKSTNEIESLISGFMQKTFKNCNSNILLNYFNFFSSWCIGEYGNLKLTKHDVKLKIAELILAPHIPEANTQRIKVVPTKKALEAFEIFVTFDLIIFDPVSNQEMNKIWEVVLRELVPLEYNWNDPIPGFYATELSKSFPLSAFSENYNELTLKKIYIMMWHAGRVPLVIQNDKSSSDQDDIFVALELIKSEINKNKIVLISDTSEIDTSGLKIFKDFSNLKDCSLSKTLFDAVTVSLQGKPKISLQQFLASDERLLNAFRTNEFVSMLDDTLLIGDDCKKDLPEYYITRTVPKILLNSEVITALDNDLFVISVEDNHNLQDIFNINIIDIKQYLLLKQRGYVNTYTQFSLSYLQKVTKTNSLNNRFCLLTKNECSTEDRESICSLNRDKNCHFVRFIDTDRVEWIYTQGDIRALQNYQIDLRLLKPDDFVDDLQVFCYFKNRLNIICTDAGIGKTITTNYLKYLSSNNVWVVTVKLNLHLNFFKEKRSITETTNYLLSHEKKSLLAKNIIDVFDSKKQLVFFWDGFDEIPKEALHGAVEAVRSLSQEGYVQWLSARTNLKNYLERSFNSFALTLTPFTPEDQLDYVKWHLRKKIRNEESFETITNKINENISTSFNSSYLDYTGSPLHIHMLTEIYLHKLEEGMDDYHFVSLTDMYQHFIKGKFDTMFEKAEADSDNYFMEQIRNEYKTAQLNLYEIAAVKSTFEDIDLKFDELLNEISINEDSVGLIVGITTERKVIFAHKTYEEFLAASWLAKNWKHHKELLLNLFEEEYNSIRFMFDLLLANDRSVHLAVLHRNIDMLEKHKIEIIDSKDKAGRNALQVACSWGRRHPRVIESKNDQEVTERTQEEFQQLYEHHLLYLTDTNKNISKIMDVLSSSSGLEAGSKIYKNLFNRIDDSLNHNPDAVTISAETIVKVSEEDKDYLKILELLLTCQCNPLDCDDLFEWNAFQYADRTFSLATINDMLKHCKVNICQTLNYCNHIPTLIHYSVIFFYDKILNNVDDIPYIEYKYQFGRNSMLQQATDCDNLQAVSTLLQFQFYKDVINNEGAFLGNPLSSASSSGNLEMVSLLLKNGSYIRGHKLPPVFATTLYNKPECCEKLLEAGADVNEISVNGNSPLMLSVMTHQLNMTELLLQNNADVNCVYQDFSILQIAVGLNSIKLVTLVLKHKPNINRQCETLGYTALHHASEMSSVEMVEILLKHGADPKIKSNKLYTPLLVALANRKSDIALKLIEADPSTVNEFSLEDNGDKLTPMMLAAQYNHPEVIKILHQCGADLHIPENISNPLHVAVGNGHVSATIALINAGASVNQPTKEGVYPLFCATKQLPTLQILLNNSAEVNAKTADGLTALHLAAINGKLDVVEELVRSGVKINDEDSSGNTPLVYSVTNKHLDVVIFLIENGAKVEDDSKLLCAATRNDFRECIPILVQNGANINAENVDEVLPLHLALIYSNSCVEVLLYNGADPDVKFTDKSLAPLHVAAIKRDIFSMVLLTSYDADVNTVNSEGLTPLHILCDGDLTLQDFQTMTNFEEIRDKYSVGYNSHDCIKELIRKGANPNSQDEEGTTPLHFACKYKNTEIIKLLIDSGADVNAQTAEKLTPLHIAMAIREMQVVDLLFQAGALLDITDKYGNKPLDYALNRIGSQEINHVEEEELEKLRLLGANLNSPVKPHGTTLLHLACSEGNLKLAQYLIEHDADIEQKTTDSEASALLNACINNHKQIVSLLLKNNCNINTQTKEGNTVLHLTCLKGHKEILEILLHSGIDVNIRNAYGVTALQLCLTMYTMYKNPSAETKSDKIYSTDNLSHPTLILNYFEMVKMLLDYQVEVDEACFLQAVTSNDLDVVKLLAEKNQNLNFNSAKLVETVLNAEVKNEQLLNYLLENGSDPNCPIGETTALQKACKIDCCGFVKWLLQHGAAINTGDKSGVTPLMSTCSNKDLQIASLLLDHGADVNQKDEHGQSALFYASQMGNLELVKLLHARGANISLENNDGTTALTFAYRHKPVVKYLIENGIDVNHKNNILVTALHSACHSGEYECVALLIENKADVNAITVDGYTPMYLASVSGRFDVVNLLIESEAAIDVPNNHGNTSLFAAAARGFLSIVEALGKHGANVNVLDVDGDTPLHDAACYGYLNVVQYLFSKNADGSIKNHNGKTPLDLAVEKGHEDVADFLRNVNVT